MCAPIPCPGPPDPRKRAGLFLALADLTGKAAPNILSGRRALCVVAAGKTSRPAPVTEPLSWNRQGGAISAAKSRPIGEPARESEGCHEGSACCGFGGCARVRRLDGRRGSAKEAADDLYGARER